MCNNHRNPIQCILPPYIADKMKNNDKMKPEETLDNQLRTHRFRSDREFMATLPHADQQLMAVKKTKATKPKPIVQVYNVAKGINLPGTLMTAEAIAKDKDAKNVQDAAGYTWDFYYSIFKRNSIDDAGMILVNSVHYSKKYNNAMWNGRQMVFGDGDRVVFDSFTEDIDIIGHELTHGVTQYTANLDYEGQSGALNEHFSDVFGIMIKQYALKQDVNQSNWLIGENVMIGPSFALRSMAAPGTAYKNHPQYGDDPQPATMDKYMKLPNTEAGDWGGVHYNSGIPNFAFCMAAKAVGGYSWETVGKVWYAALTQSLQNNSDFAAMKKATVAHAKKLFGTNSKVHKAVISGWAAAKVK